MKRFLLAAILLTLVLSNAFAQKKDTSVYYVTNNGKFVSTKDSADYFRLILPPDTTIDKNLKIMKEYYKDGKPKLMANLTSNLKYDGTVISFFHNGHRMEIKNYDAGNPTGDIIAYYPNGKLYNIKTYKKTETEDVNLLLESCRDSTGKVIAENGNGNWINYNNDFSQITETGKVTNGYQDSIWTIFPNSDKPYQRTFKNGKIISYDNNQTPAYFGTAPLFPGGLEAFYKFLVKNIRYPYIAEKRQIQGRVLVSFVVEKDGNLTEIKVIKSLGSGCDEEAMRVIKLSPPWKPGIQNGQPVRCQYTVPIQFPSGE